MLTNVQVLAGTTSVARLGDAVVWFETGSHGGGATLTQLLQAVEDVSSGTAPSYQLGARLADVLNAADATAVPALVAAAPEDDGLRVVVHGWGSVVADGLHIPCGWADQVVNDRRTFFLGRNTVSPVAPAEGSTLDLEDGVVPGDGVSFFLTPAAVGAGAAHAPAPGRSPLAGRPSPSSDMPVAASPRAPSAAPVAEAPPAPVSSGPLPDEPPAYEPPPSDPPAEPRRGRLVLDDGSSAMLERTCVLGAAPHASPAVQTGVALPLTVPGTGVAAIHIEIRVEPTRVAVRDLGSAPTYVLVPGATTWSPLAPGQIIALALGSRIAIGQRTVTYEPA